MKYALGNMLNGAGGLNPDGLSLDLQFATDKTLTARKGPTPTFGRASGATQVNAAGLIEYAPENILQRSEEFNDIYWTPIRATVTANQSTSPTGATTADKLVVDSTAAANHRVDRASVTLSLNTVYTASIYIKASEYSGFAIGIDASSPVLGVQFSLSGSGSVTAQLAGYSGAIQDVGNGWFRCSATFTSSASIAGHRVYMFLGQDGTTFTYTGDGTSGVFIWGAQLERYASARTYIPTNTADVFNARFDHDPITLACRGLLIEESRTNLTKRSDNDFSNAYWNSTANNVTAVDSVTTSPTGVASTASSITEIAGVSVTRHIHQATGEFTPAASSAYTMSAWVKQPPTNPVRYVQLAFWVAGFGSTAYMNYDIQTGVVGTGGAGITASSIVAYPNGWYRISATATSLASPASSGFQLGFSTTSGAVRTEAYTVVSPLKSIYLWGAQIEAGAFPTSYIPTTTASLARSADVCSITGANFTGMYNQTEGSMLVNAFTPASGARIVVSADNDSTTEVNKIFTNVTLSAVEVVDGGAQQAALLPGSIVANTAFKLASAYKLNDFAASRNGAAAVTDASGTIPTPNQLKIGYEKAGNTMCGCVASLRYYKKRLPDAKLASLTA